MRTKAIVVIGLIAGLAGTPAGAAPGPRPRCPLIRDALGDTAVQGSVVVAPSLDITSVDIGTDRRVTVLAVAIRVADLDAPTDPFRSIRRRYAVRYKAPGARLFTVLAVDVSPLSASFGYGTANTPDQYLPLGQAFGVVDTARDEIRIWAKVSDLRKLKDTGTYPVGGLLTDISATATMEGYVIDGAADPRARYALGSPSCILVGR